MKQEKKKAALVLSGGSILGLAHLGVIEELQKAGYEFDAIYGVSAGAIVGAGLANGMSPKEIKAAFFSADFLSIAKDFSPLNTGLLKGRRLREYFNTLLDGKNIKDLPVPFKAGATDFDSGEYIQINIGNVADAMRASSSLPMIFEPHLHPDYGRYLADGGLTRNFIIRDALEEYAGDTIIGINVHPVHDLPKDFHKKKLWGWKKDMFTYLNHSFNIMVNAQWEEPTDPRVIIISPDLKEYKGFSIHKKNYEPIIEKGRLAAREFLNNQE